MEVPLVMRPDYDIARRRMVREQVIANGISDPRVIEVMRTLPRHIFLDPEAGVEAYSKHAFPIGFAQTMSQPYMVAYLAEHLNLLGEEVVLEIGTGSGYQAAVLSRLASRVYTVERIPELASKARTALDSLGIENVHVASGDGALGWPDAAPFDRILLTAAASGIPDSLLEQLREGGIMLGPALKDDGSQEIVRLRRERAGFSLERLKDCAFVPLVRGPDGGAAVPADPHA